MSNINFGAAYAADPTVFDEALRRIPRADQLLRQLVVHGDRNRAIQDELDTVLDSLDAAVTNLRQHAGDFPLS